MKDIDTIAENPHEKKDGLRALCCSAWLGSVFTRRMKENKLDISDERLLLQIRLQRESLRHFRGQVATNTRRVFWYLLILASIYPRHLRTLGEQSLRTFLRRCNLQRGIGCSVFSWGKSSLPNVPGQPRPRLARHVRMHGA